MKIYAASSWRNDLQPSIVDDLRAQGHEVYDFRHPPGGDHLGFSWSDVDPDWTSWTPEQYVAALEHPIAVAGFESDFAAMDWAETMRRFGPIIPGRAAFVKAFDDWRHEQHTPEPTPLRAIDVTSPAFEEAIRREAPEGWEVDRTPDGTLRVSVDAGEAHPKTSPKARKDQALADATAHRLGRSPAAPRGSAQAAARPVSDDRIGKLVCQGSNHVPGHTADCPWFGQS